MSALIAWHGLLDSMLEAVCLLDATTLRVLAVNNATCKLLGMAKADLLGSTVHALTPAPEDLCFWEDVVAGVADHIHSDTLICNANGMAVPVERSVSRVCLDSANMVFVMGMRDLRPQRRDQELLENRMAELRATLESTADGILVLDLTGKICHFNRRFAELWCVPVELTETCDELALHSHMLGCVRDSHVYEERLVQIAKDPQSAETDFLQLHSGRVLERVTLPQMSRGRAIGRVYSFRDHTERIDSERRLKSLAFTDSLTGLPNRLMLTQTVDATLRLAQRTGGKFAVLFIDLDRFKTINDTLGHGFGDEVLIEVTQRLRRCSRDVDTLCRLDGDEFVIFLPSADAIGMEVVARRVLECMAQPFFVDNMDFSMGCSIGIALYPADGKTFDDLIQCANTAMCQVKERGRGNYRFYQPQMNVDLRARMKMDHSMRRAMEQGLFQLYYQPQISLIDGRLVGAEALIRWRDPQIGYVPPGTFIPLAEESGFIINVGNWVLVEAVRQAALWQRTGRSVVVSVNVSAMQFQQTDFVERVARCIKDAGLDPALLELELTESILVQDADEALARLHALANLGLSLAIDDFGTGYSSLAYLKKFPISKLKIDRAFVTGLPSDESDRAIVGATIAMAHALKLSVVAEAVETIAQRDFLHELHCECYQGYLCSPALAAADFEYLAENLPKGGRASPRFLTTRSFPLQMSGLALQH